MFARKAIYVLVLACSFLQSAAHASTEGLTCNVKATVRDTLDREFLSREKLSAVLGEKGYTLLDPNSPEREEFSLNVEVDSIGHWSIVPEVVLVRLVKDGDVSRPVFHEIVQANPLFRGVNIRRAMRILRKLPKCTITPTAATTWPRTTLSFLQGVHIPSESTVVFSSGKIHSSLSEVPAGAPVCKIHGAYHRSTAERLTRTIRAGSAFWIVSARAGLLNGDAKKPAVRYGLIIVDFGCDGSIEEALKNVLTDGAACPSIVSDIATHSYGLMMTCWATKSGPLMDEDVSLALEGIARIDRVRF